MNKDMNKKQNEQKDPEEQINQDKKNVNHMGSFVKKLKYGSVAMIFTIVFVALIFILNVVTTTMNNVNPMMIDMTKEQIYGISDATRELLKDITDPVEIVFFQPIDMYEKTVPGGKMIVNIIKEYANEFDNITYSSMDIIKNPGIANEFKASGVSQTPSTTSIAIRSKGKPKLYSYSSFFVTFESTNSFGGFAGERTLTSGILQAISVDSPKVYFTTGHSESYPDAILGIFANNGFVIGAVDLSVEDLDPEAKILVICNPLKDFIGADPGNPAARSEIDKVASFLNSFGSVMYFSSPDVGALPELDDLLKEYGMAFEHDYMVYGDEKSSIGDRTNISAEYFVAGNVGDELTASIRNLPSPPKTVVPRVKPVKILDIAGERAVSPVLVSSKDSYKVNISDSTDVVPGSGNLLVVAQKTQYIDNDPKTSLFLVCGSYEFLGALPSNSYSNSDVILNAMRIMTSKKIVVDIKWKEFDNSKLSMTIEQQNRWTIICILLLPSLVSVWGIVVWLRRRHS